MQQLNLKSFNEFIDEKIQHFIDQAKSHSRFDGYHNSPGAGMDIGWIDCARYIKQMINEEFNEEFE